MNQSECLAVTRKLIKAGENSRVQGVSWPYFGFASHCLKIRPCHKAAILTRGTKKALFYHAKPHPHGFHCEA